MPQVKCEYCGAFIDETAEKCPNCGAVNKNFKRIVSDTPQTIQQLQEWYKARKLPPMSVTRYFIGRDIKEPKAFGIYKDGPDFIVYKNKANGQRAIRYKGTDEAYAVNEIYMKLKSEILEQKSRSISRKRSPSRNTVSGQSLVLYLAMAFGAFVSIGVSATIVPLWIVGLLFLIATVCFVIFRKNLAHFIVACAILVVVSLAGTVGFLLGYRSNHRHDGYYTQGGNYYYFYGNDVYTYDYDDWYYYDTYDDFTYEYPDYDYVSDEYYETQPYTDFKDSYYYDDAWDSSSSSSSSSSDWSSDSDYDWDSDSDWDSGGSDWDSDW